MSLVRTQEPFPWNDLLLELQELILKNRGLSRSDLLSFSLASNKSRDTYFKLVAEQVTMNVNARFLAPRGLMQSQNNRLTAEKLRGNSNLSVNCVVKMVHHLYDPFPSQLFKRLFLEIISSDNFQEIDNPIVLQIAMDKFLLDIGIERPDEEKDKNFVTPDNLDVMKNLVQACQLSDLFGKFVFHDSLTQAAEAFRNSLSDVGFPALSEKFHELFLIWSNDPPTCARFDAKERSICESSTRDIPYQRATIEWIFALKIHRVDRRLVHEFYKHAEKLTAAEHESSRALILSANRLTNLIKLMTVLEEFEKRDGQRQFITDVFVKRPGIRRGAIFGRYGILDGLGWEFRPHCILDAFCSVFEIYDSITLREPAFFLASTTYFLTSPDSSAEEKSTLRQFFDCLENLRTEEPDKFNCLLSYFQISPESQNLNSIFKMLPILYLQHRILFDAFIEFLQKIQDSQQSPKNALHGHFANSIQALLDLKRTDFLKEKEQVICDFFSVYADDSFPNLMKLMGVNFISRGSLHNCSDQVPVSGNFQRMFTKAYL